MGLAIPKRLKKDKRLARAPAFEADTTERVSGILVHRSGAGSVKGDVRLKGVARIECKQTARRSFSVNEAMIDKIEDAAVPANEIPIIRVQLGNGRSVWIIPEWAGEGLVAAQGD